jgi:nicotinamidase-related amidase
MDVHMNDRMNITMNNHMNTHVNIDIDIPSRTSSEQESPLSSPPPRELPETSRALLLLSVQRAPLADPENGGMPHAPRVRRNIARVLRAARSADPAPLIVHVRHDGDVGESDQRGTPGWQLWTDVHSGERVVDKRKTSAWSGTALDEMISPEAEVIVVGCASDSCVYRTCMDAVARGNAVSFIISLCLSISSLCVFRSSLSGTPIARTIERQCIPAHTTPSHLQRSLSTRSSAG